MFVLKHYRSNRTCPLNENNVSAVSKRSKKKKKKDFLPDATVTGFHRFHVQYKF